MVDDDPFLFDDEDTAASGAPLAAAPAPWHVLVVDDDPEVHAVTRLALRNFTFEDRPLTLLSAHSAQEAREVLAHPPDIALILLDVVMETEDAGLQLVRHIRQTRGDRAVRIILRTGQPGSAPEDRVVREFDINDYRTKTELTYDRLTLCTLTALRSYRDIMAVETSNRALLRIAGSAVGMFRSNTMSRLLGLVLEQLADILGGAADAVFCARQTDHVTLAPETSVVAGFGRYAGCIGQPLEQALAAADAAAVTAVIDGGGHSLGADRIILAIAPSGRWSGAALVRVARPACESLAPLLEVFVAVVTAALDNAYLMEELRRSNKATVVALAHLAESKDADTGEHVLRVARLTSEITRELRRHPHPELLDPLFLEQIGLASMLHDVGKVGIPDDILKKRGVLLPDERAVMETHPLLGGRTLDKARQVVSSSCALTLGWEIATGHHEAFDGSGYPLGLRGTEIPLSARIVAVADVFDALTMPRSYKPAWPVRDAIGYIRERCGRQFDPEVVDALMAVLARRASRPRILWTPEMSVGHDQLDADHQVLIELINRLSAGDSDDDRTSIEFVIDELVQYTLMHFAREEALLEEIGYPELAEHRAAHAALAGRVEALRTRFCNGLSGRLGDDILDFLGNWLRDHILREDRGYAALLKERTPVTD